MTDKQEDRDATRWKTCCKRAYIQDGPSLMALSYYLALRTYTHG
jgi:hypothetical protein